MPVGRTAISAPLTHSAGRKSFKTMDVMQTIFHRRSIRRFDPRQIEEEALEPEMKAKLRLALLT